MGARGRGSARLMAAREANDGVDRPMPWLEPGLKRAQRVIAFLEFLPITKGILAGKSMKLLPGQKRFIRDVYGRPASRPCTMAIKSEPRGNGKTGLVSGLALCHLLGPEAEPRGGIYSAAIDREQAGIVFREMEAICFAVPEFARLVNISRFTKRIEVMEGPGDGSIYEALSSDARGAHGLAPSFWVYDELAQARNRELLDNLITGMGKRKQALGMVISTQAATDQHVLSEMIDDAMTGSDPSVVVHLLAAPADADPFAEETIKACNPALGKFLKYADLRKEADRAQRLPSFEASYRNLRLNQRVDAREELRVITVETWKACGGAVDLEALAGRQCYGGLDLSGKHDLCSLVLAFPDDGEPPTYDIVAFHWTPDGQLQNRTPGERERFREWISEGVIEAVPGATVRYGFIAERLAMLAGLYDIVSIGYDRWRIDDLKVELADIGAELPLEPVGQGFKDMAPAIELLSELAMTERLRHGNNPVLTAAVSNAIVVSDPAGNMKFDKQRGNGRGPVRIDGAVAMTMAISTTSVEAPQYVTGELIVV